MLDDETEADRVAQENAQLLRQQEIDDIVWQMSSKRGRRLMCRLLATAGVHHNPWNISESVTSFNCGRMNVGQVYQTEVLTLCPDKYLLLLKEQNE